MNQKKIARKKVRQYCAWQPAPKPKPPFAMFKFFCFVVKFIKKFKITISEKYYFF